MRKDVKNFNPTHKVTFYKIPCYWDERTHTLATRIRNFDFLINWAAHFHIFMNRLYNFIDPSFQGFDFSLVFQAKLKNRENIIG